MSETGFLTMGRAETAEDILQGPFARPPDGLLYGLIAATAAGTRLDCSERRGRARQAAKRYGFSRSTTRREELVSDPEIGLFDNSGPNHLHAEPTVAAAEAGKHVICENPLGRSVTEAFEIWERVTATCVVNLCAFNYRSVPNVRLAHRIIEAGALGEIHHFRFRYRDLHAWDTTDAAV